MWEITVRDVKGELRARATLDSGSLNVGRSPDNDLVVRDQAMSRQHARIEIRDGDPWIVDLGSVNGVLVDGARISAPQRLDAASRVELSGLFLEVSPALAVPAETAGKPPPSPYADDEAERDAANLLEQKINSIRSHRQQQSDARASKQREFEEEWESVLEELRQLRAKMKDEERVRYFTVGRDGNTVALKIQRKSGQTSLLMTRGHPDRPVAGETRVYVRDHVWPDRSFDSPRDALNQLLSQIASLLA